MACGTVPTNVSDGCGVAGKAARACPPLSSRPPARAARRLHTGVALPSAGRCGLLACLLPASQGLASPFSSWPACLPDPGTPRPCLQLRWRRCLGGGVESCWPSCSTPTWSSLPSHVSQLQPQQGAAGPLCEAPAATCPAAPQPGRRGMAAWHAEPCAVDPALPRQNRTGPLAPGSHGNPPERRVKLTRPLPLFSCFLSSADNITAANSMKYFAYTYSSFANSSLCTEVDPTTGAPACLAVAPHAAARVGPASALQPPQALWGLCRSRGPGAAGRPAPLGLGPACAPGGGNTLLIPAPSVLYCRLLH